MDVGHTVEQPLEFLGRKRGAEARDPSRDLYSRCGNSLSFSLVDHYGEAFHRDRIGFCKNLSADAN